MARQDSRPRRPEKDWGAGVHTLLKLVQLRWTGHDTEMPDERLPKKILYGELQVRKRSHGGQKKRYKDTLKASLKDFNIPTVVGADCTGSSKVARSHKRWCRWIRSKMNQRSQAETCSEESQSEGITNRAFFLRPLLFYLQLAVKS